MITRFIILAFACFAILSSCGPSKYTALSDTWNSSHGYEDAALDSSTYQVTYHGDVSMNAALVDRYALFRSAELTTEKGYDYFVVLDASSQTGALTSAPTHHTEIEHDIDPQSGKFVPVAVTTTETSSMPTHTVTKTIRIFKGRRPGENANAFDAKSMIAVMGPTIERADK